MNASRRPGEQHNVPRRWGGFMAVIGLGLLVGGVALLLASHPTPASMRLFIAIPACGLVLAGVGVWVLVSKSSS